MKLATISRTCLLTEVSMSTIEVFTDHLTLTTDKEPVDKDKEESKEESKENN